MLPWLSQHLEPFFGPFRLLRSYVFLGGLGAALAVIACWVLLPRLWARLPKDKGRAHAVGAQVSVGKPVAAGIIFVPIFLAVCLLILPFDWTRAGILACLALVLLEGFWDDCRPGGLGECALGVMDLLLALAAALLLSGFGSVTVWLPFLKSAIPVPLWVYVPAAATLIWITVNATNCTDGVDGLSGSLAVMAFAYLGGILYGVIGHKVIAQYLLVPHNPQGASWALMAMVMAACLCGYLWHNAHPSAVLMGDAGSRPMGFLMGVLVLVSGNPFLIVVVASVMLVNGGTGLVKIALLRFFRIGIFRDVRYPLHDHVRHKLGWSNPQVLVRFMLLQAVITPVLLVVLFKVR